jgi:hypothetical protein
MPGQYFFGGVRRMWEERDEAQGSQEFGETKTERHRARTSSVRSNARG